MTSGAAAAVASPPLEPSALVSCVRAVLAGTAAAAATASPLCACILAVWKFLDLPEVDGEASEVSRRLWNAIYVSLAVHGLCAPFCSSEFHCLLLVYASVCAAITAFPCACGVLLSARRLLRNAICLTPLVWHYALLDLWTKRTGLSKKISDEYRARLDTKYAPRLFKLFVEQGGIYVKFGQFLSLFPPGLIPEVYMAEFRKLQGEVTSMPIERVREVLGREYGKPLEEVFSSFDATPLGAASIGQAHRARLAADGRDVVVKVQHANLADSMWADYWTAFVVLNILARELRPLLKHVKAWIRKELDFKEEASVLARVHENLHEVFPKVVVPKPVQELCTSRIIVMSFVPGVSVLQAVLRIAAVVLGEKGSKALEGLFSEEGGSEDTAVAASRTLSGGTLGGAVVAGFGSLILAWRRRRALLRILRRALLASGATAAVLAAAAFSAGRPRLNALGLSTANVGGFARLFNRATALRLIQHSLASARSATNASITLYNGVAGLVGARRLKYRKEIPKFDPDGVCAEIWKVQGHQLFVDGLFNSDTHPGNFLIDEKTGSIGLIDFGQACDMPLRYRVLFARQVVAIAEGDDREIALRHAHLGYRSKQMTVAVLAANARIKYGAINVAVIEDTIRHVEKLKEFDPLDEETIDPDLMLLERMVGLLRGTGTILGARLERICPPVVWLDFARTLLAKHDSEVEEPDIELSDALPEREEGCEVG